MASFRTFVVGVLTLLVVGGATLLYCETPGDALSAEKRPPISYVSRLLTLPLSFSNASDLRIACLPIGTGLLWLYLAIAGVSPINRTLDSPRGESRRGRGLIAPPRDPLVALSIATLVIAIVAAMSNDTWAISRGWCFNFACGAAWAIGLAALIRSDADGRIAVASLSVMAMIATAACILTFWHRATLDIQFVRWPIGPLTITGCLAGVWAATALGLITGIVVGREKIRPPYVFMAIGLLILILAATLAYVSGRRSGFLGIAAAIAVCASVYLFARWPRGRAATVLAVGLVAATTLIGIWIKGQRRSSAREVSGPIAIRHVYYSAASSLIAANPLFGIGPDMTLCRVTTDIARQRAEHPHVIHGSTVPALHSEWMQAALELGIPGGLIYLAIPLSVIGAGAWIIVRCKRKPDNVENTARNEAILTPLLMASLAGITSIVVIEATSINLRGAVMPATFWTLLGLAAGLAQRIHGSHANPISPKSAPTSRLELIPRVFMFGFGVLVMLLSLGELQRAHAHEKGRSLRATDPTTALLILDSAADRFGAENWLVIRIDRGLIESDVSRALRNSAANKSTTTMPAASQPQRDAVAEGWTAAAVATWEQIVRRCPGYPGAGGFLGEALLGANRVQDARSVFLGYLEEFDPYDQAANLMVAGAFTDDPLRKIDCVRRGLRAGAIEPIGRRIFLDALKTESIVGLQWGGQVQFAVDLIANHPIETWQDPLAPETLRMEAVRLMSIGELSAASAIQDQAANAYKRLYDENHPARRAAAAEIDAWKISADVRFESDPGEYRAAFERVLIAERFAVLSIQHEYRRNPPADAEFVGGVVTPVESPDALAPLWRLSAKLHIAVGRNREESLTPRLLNAMTNAQREALMAQGTLFQAANGLRLRLMAELVAACQRIAPERRPPSYDAWLTELHAAGVTTQPATTAPTP